MCGGQGKRIGGNKPLYNYKTDSLLNHAINNFSKQADEIILSFDKPQNPIIKEINQNYKIVFDEYENLGPIVGILSGLKYAKANYSEFNYIIAPCDMPLIPEDYCADLLKSSKNEIAYYKGVRDYPLCAKIPVEYIQEIENEVKANQNGVAVYKLWQKLNAITINIKDETKFLNINTAL